MIHQASIEAAALPAERIARALEDADPAPLAVGLFDRGNGRFEVFAHYDAPPARDELLALIEAAGAGGELGPLAIEAVAQADWVTLSQGKRGPVRAGRFYVHGSHDRERAPSHRFVIEIDAGRAFGTAHHATTRGCLLALDDILKRRRPLKIVDIGTGTGILAIAAAHALKRRVLASDSDPIAVRTARDNAANNCALRSVQVAEANGFTHPRLWVVKADLVLANLLERAHYDLAPAYARHVLPGGTAVLSGLTETQARSIEARTRNYGFVLEKRIILDGWATLVIVRRNVHPRRD
ncbi:MAG TPA: 50S ribosomal protein L11 methyltransferase [Methyloceanibacter sp.]|nr:50S ribosomal protein L11 methyltransferase [Methyloceanibacter sp.]